MRRAEAELVKREAAWGRESIRQLALCWLSPCKPSCSVLASHSASPLAFILPTHIPMTFRGHSFKLGQPGFLTHEGTCGGYARGEA